MTDEKQKKEVENIQKIIARYVATHPVGRNLALIGGFRYRFLNTSVRTSDDIDYHWAGDIEEKQRELIASFRRGLFPEVSRLIGYSGTACARTGLDADSPVVKIVNLSFWRDGVPYSRIEIPVEVTCIACVDRIEIRTAEGNIYATVSDGDIIESKVIAVFGRTTMKHRDIMDLFLFQDYFLPDSAQRLKSKLHALMMNDNEIKKKMCNLQEHADYHAKATQEVIDTQLDPEARNQLNDSGGGRMVFDTVIGILNRHIHLEKTIEND